MTMEPSDESAKQYLRLADEALSDAGYLLEAGRLKAASNRAYYAMFYAAHAALAAAKVNAPRTHGGLVNVFGKEFVTTGKVSRELAKDLQEAYDLRQQSDYQLYYEVGEDEVAEVVATARAFVDEVRNLVSSQ